ncbi:unnamed protein product [Acanthosepion pharaonis]|uniref:Uncharacterized protein n=1 Tax=Acanthosepion pharaonis TaxID=158019 RepID=A0A812CK86_ACAPH|nr:unnamed protein product [Sepia pharaonis]
MNSISVRSNTFNILGLVPIHSTNTTKETTELRSATNNLKLQYLVTNASVDLKVYNNCNQEEVVMEIMLETFSQQNNLTAIIGPSKKNVIHKVTQFLDTIPARVLHIVYNPVIVSKEYLHNIAPSVSLVADLLVNLMLKMKWNYIAKIENKQVLVGSYGNELNLNSKIKTQNSFCVKKCKKQRIFDDDGNSRIQNYSLLRIENIDPPKFEKLATFDSTTWEIKKWNELASLTSTCDTEDSCTVCYVKTDNVYTVFVILCIVTTFSILVVSGIFVWKKKENLPCRRKS